MSHAGRSNSAWNSHSVVVAVLASRASSRCPLWTVPAGRAASMSPNLTWRVSPTPISSARAMWSLVASGTGCRVVSRLPTARSSSSTTGATFRPMRISTAVPVGTPSPTRRRGPRQCSTTSVRWSFAYRRPSCARARHWLSWAISLRWGHGGRNVPCACRPPAPTSGRSRSRPRGSTCP